ncbi:MAG: tRNA 2-thiocytidine biosynthesis protein TtcA, partial [Clostridia bacterium]|nr:tRNA 2-thiocytidine biosynthesis protein TtcA [Clostridia bacterium]
MTECQRIERTIFKTYRKSIWQPFVGALKQYQLVEASDKIAVCVSGGKDSFLLAMCMRQLQRHSDVPFTVEYICLDCGWNESERQTLETIAQTLELPLVIRDVPLFRVVKEQSSGSPCYLCARMRRGWLYKIAAELGCNKIALGHHRDDVNETLLMSMFYGAEIKTMMPKLRASNYEGMELIRPLYAVTEYAIRLGENDKRGYPMGRRAFTQLMTYLNERVEWTAKTAAQL